MPALHIKMLTLVPSQRESAHLLSSDFSTENPQTQTRTDQMSALVHYAG